MEVGLKVFVEDMLTGETRHTSSAYLTFVAIDGQGNRVPVPPVIPETEDENDDMRKPNAAGSIGWNLRRGAKKGVEAGSPGNGETCG